MGSPVLLCSFCAQRVRADFRYLSKWRELSDRVAFTEYRRACASCVSGEPVAVFLAAGWSLGPVWSSPVLKPSTLQR